MNDREIQKHKAYLRKRRIRDKKLRDKRRAEREEKGSVVEATKKKTRKKSKRGRPSKYLLLLPDGSAFRSSKPVIRKRVEKLIDEGTSPDDIGLYEQSKLEVETVTKVTFPA